MSNHKTSCRSTCYEVKHTFLLKQIVSMFAGIALFVRSAG
uniref:ATY1 n=1 Tax=Arundo donax TaxID=35708 RepID=A0A0A9G474_ARUDO